MELFELPEPVEDDANLPMGVHGTAPDHEEAPADGGAVPENGDDHARLPIAGGEYERSDDGGQTGIARGFSSASEGSAGAVRAEPARQLLPPWRRAVRFSQDQRGTLVPDTTNSVEGRLV